MRVFEGAGVDGSALVPAMEQAAEYLEKAREKQKLAELGLSLGMTFDADLLKLTKPTEE